MFFDCPYDTHFECYNHKQIYFVKTSSKRLKLRYSYSILFVFIEIFWCHHVARALYLYRKPPKNIPEKTLVLNSAKTAGKHHYFGELWYKDLAKDQIRDIWTRPTDLDFCSTIQIIDLRSIQTTSGKSRKYTEITSKNKLI